MSKISNVLVSDPTEAWYNLDQIINGYEQGRLILLLFPTWAFSLSEKIQVQVQFQAH